MTCHVFFFIGLFGVWVHRYHEIDRVLSNEFQALLITFTRGNNIGLYTHLNLRLGRKLYSEREREREKERERQRERERERLKFYFDGLLPIPCPWRV